MDKRKFYEELKRADVPLFGRSLSQGQVEGMEADITEALKRGIPTKQFAAILAEEYHETGAKMQPVSESLNYSVEGLLSTFSRQRISKADAQRLGRKKGEGPLSQDRQRQIANLIYGGEWGRKNLGNTEPNDGWDRRGRGKVQITGRANDRKFGIEHAPEKALEMATSTFILFEGILKGLFTGKRLDQFVTATKSDYRGSRACVNDDVAKNGNKIAEHAVAFEACLLAAGYGGEKRDTLVTDPDQIKAVQQTLKDLGYTEVGVPDGMIGKQTRAAVLAAKNENDFKPLDAEITPSFVAALMTWPARDLPRQDAAPVVVRENAPEVKANFVSKWIGAAGAGGAGVVGASQAVLEQISPWKTLFSDIPSWVWLLAAAGAFGAIMYFANRGEKAGTEAYRTGERR